MLSKQHFAPLLCYNVLLAVYGTLLMTIIPASESNSESKIEILSLLPFISCPHDSSPGRNESLNITFLRNYHLPNSLCDLSKAAKQGLDDAAADFNLLDEANTITISHEQTQCQVDEGTRQLFRFFSKKQRDRVSSDSQLFVFGPICPHVTRQIAATLNFFHTAQILYGVQTPEFSDSRLYPHVRRWIPSFTQLSLGVVFLTKQYNWERVALVSQWTDPFNVFSEARSTLSNKFLAEKVDSTSFLFKTHQDIWAMLLEIKKKNLRIIIGLFDLEEFLSTVICLADELDLITPRHQWVLGSFNANPLADMSESCQLVDTHSLGIGPSFRKSREQLLHLLRGAFVINIHDSQQSKVPDKVDANSTWNQAHLMYHYAYESVMKAPKQFSWEKQPVVTNNETSNSTFLRSNNGTESESDEMASDQMSYFISENDLTGKLDIFQYNEDSHLKLMGVFSSIEVQYINISQPYWKSGKPPNDSPRVVNQVTHVTAAFYAGLCAIASGGMVLSLVFLVFNVKNRNIRFIKMSSPNLNNVIIVGCLLSYTSVFLLGFDSNVAQHVLHIEHYHAICSIRGWCLTCAFTLSYGSMFSKTWRVHQIFTNVKMKKKVIKDYQLFVVIVFFLFVDIMLLISWELLDPMKIKRTKTSTVSVSADEDHVLFSDKCHCQYMARWLALLYGYKGLTMLFGCFLAWETRSVTIPALNDSKYIGINVYVVMLVCLVSIGVTSVIDDADHSFILLSTLIIFATTITLCLVFVPKLVQFKKVDVNQRQRFSVATTTKLPKAFSPTQKTGTVNVPKSSQISKVSKQTVKLSNDLPPNVVNTNSLHPTPKKACRTLSNQQNCTPSDNEKDSSLIPSSSLSADAVTAAKMSSDAIKLEIAKNRESLHQKQADVAAITHKLELYFGLDLIEEAGKFECEAPTGELGGLSLGVDVGATRVGGTNGSTSRYNNSTVSLNKPQYQEITFHAPELQPSSSSARSTKYAR